LAQALSALPCSPALLRQEAVRSGGDAVEAANPGPLWGPKMQYFLDRFLCSCSSTSRHDELILTGGVLAGFQSRCSTVLSDAQAAVSVDLPTSAGPMPGETAAYAATLGAAPKDISSPYSPKELFGRSAKVDAHGSGAGAPASSRSTASCGSDMDGEEKAREKMRLQRLLRDFAKEVVAGIAVNLVNPLTGRRPPYFFQMDRHLTVFSLKPKDGSTAESSVQDFNMKDIVSIYKGQEVMMKAPSLGCDAAECVGLDTNRADRRLFFHFDDHYERDKFYTCLRIMRMSVDIKQSN